LKGRDILSPIYWVITFMFLYECCPYWSTTSFNCNSALILLYTPRRHAFIEDLILFNCYILKYDFPFKKDFDSFFYIILKAWSYFPFYFHAISVFFCLTSCFQLKVLKASSICLCVLSIRHVTLLLLLMWVWCLPHGINYEPFHHIIIMVSPLLWFKEISTHG
jgi:hypothetical protein